MTRRRINNFDPDGFARFWEDYPRHEGRLDAYKAWCQKEPTSDTQINIHLALEWQKRQRQWLDNVRFIPLPASYLRGERWTDEAPSVTVKVGVRRKVHNEPL